MRINKFVALTSGLSRRGADAAIAEGRVLVNGSAPQPGQDVSSKDQVRLDGRTLVIPQTLLTIMLNKPTGYVCSRNGQRSKTIYDLLPPALHQLKPVGRLDKDSSGLLLMTNDGKLAHELTHPSFHKVKCYEIGLDQPLAPLHRQMISEFGIELEDGRSKLTLNRLDDGDDQQWLVEMHEGRNRQIRRTFAALGYTVTRLHRISFGTYTLDNLTPGETREVSGFNELSLFGS